MEFSYSSYDPDSIFAFAYCGSEETIYNNLLYIKNIAEPECWGFNDENEVKILRAYIFKTFRRCKQQNKILYSADKKHCCFNTGLLTPNGKDIIMTFEPNTYDLAKTDWYWTGVKRCTDIEFMELYDKVPELATYTDTPEDFFFNPYLPLEVDIEHIIDDNWERVYEALGYPKDVAKCLIEAAVENAKKKALRNIHLCIPQYHDEKIGFMMPLEIPMGDNTWCVMGLALSKTSNNKYRGSTIYNIEQAYEKCRLLTRQEDNWLRIAVKNLDAKS